jgi:holo-[acyl-carrier protein] synthase
MLHRQGDKFRQRVYSQQELLEIGEKGPMVVRRAAMKFAAKEALLKALGTGLAQGIKWTNVEVLSQKSGAPCIELVGRASEVACELGVTKIHVSLSDSTENAVAVVILEGD